MKKFATILVTFTFLAACGVAAVVLAASAGAGQQNANSNTNQNTGGHSGGGSHSGGGGSQSGGGGSQTGGGGSQMGGGGAALSSGDRKFMQEAAVGGMAEVEMARVAVERASTETVREYARRMIEDHTRGNEELMQIASSKGVSLPTGVDAKHRSMLARLNRLSGAEFDREYVRQAGVKAHERMLKLVQNYSRRGNDPDARAFATKMVPAVQMHLNMAHQLHGGGAGGGMNHSGSGNTNSNQ